MKVATEPQSHRGNRSHTLWVASGLGALSASINFVLMLREPLWWDEVASARAFSQPSLAAVWTHVRENEATPPGWYTLAWLFHRVGSSLAGPHSAMASILAPRLLSVICAAAATALVTVYAARWQPLWAAALAALLVALGEQSLEHGSELRAYALLMLSSVVLAFALELAARHPGPRQLAVLAATTSIGCWTHYVLLAVVGAAVLWSITSTTVRSRSRVVAAMMVGVATIGPWVPSIVDQSRAHGHAFLGAFSPTTVLGTYSKIIAASSAWDHLRLLGSTALPRAALLVAVLTGAALLARRPESSLCAALTVLPLVIAAAAWAAGIRAFDTRNLIVVAPFAAICLSAAIAAIPHEWVARCTAVAAAIAIMLAVAAESHDGRTRFDQAAGAVPQLGWTASQPLLVFAPEYPVPLSWYLPGHPLLSRARLAARPCRELMVVSETKEGADWLRSMSGRPVQARSFAWYGTQAFGPRLPGKLIVSKLPYSAAAARSGIRAGGRLEIPHGGRAPCATEIVGTTQAY